MKIWISTEREFLPDGTVAERTNVFSSPANVVWYWHGKYGYYMSPPLTKLYDLMRKAGEFRDRITSDQDSNEVFLSAVEQELDAWYYKPEEEEEKT